MKLLHVKPPSFVYRTFRKGLGTDCLVKLYNALLHDSNAVKMNES